MTGQPLQGGRRRVAEPEPGWDWRSRMPLLFSSAVAVLAVGAVWYASRSATTRPMIVSPPGTTTAAAIRTDPLAQAPPQPVASGDPARTETRTDATAPGGKPLAPSPADATAAAPGGKPLAPSPAPPAAAPTAMPGPPEGRLAPALAPGRTPSTMLELTVEPAVEVVLDGVKVGRSPVSVPAAPGKRVLQLTDKSRGIDVKRAVVVGKEGVTRQSFTIGRGTLSVRMPDGAALALDGRSLGTRPPAEIPVYEGTHHLKVTLGDAVWQETFAIRPEQTLKYDVALKPSGNN